jgi:hypothetical protein
LEVERSLRELCEANEAHDFASVKFNGLFFLRAAWRTKQGGSAIADRA